MGMGILHSMNSTILQLNHLYVICLSGGGAIWLHALKKIFLKSRVIFLLFLHFLELSDLTEVMVETGAVKPSRRVRTISLSIIILHSPGWVKGTAAELLGPAQSNNKGASFASESQLPLLTFAPYLQPPDPSHPSNLAQERVYFYL